jgi:NAD(P)H-nitrite reductase large subunit
LRADKEPTIRTYNFPLERYCNKNSKILAKKIYQDRFNKKLADLTTSDTEHKEVIQFILNLKCCYVQKDPITFIRRKTVHLIKKKGLENIIYQIWEEQRNEKYKFAKVVELHKFLPK